MPLVFYDRVRETTTVAGTSDAVLLGAVTGFQSFAVVGNGNTCYYTIADQSGGNWEVGIGTYSTTGPTLQRTTILSSSNSNNKVSFGAGTKDIFLTYPSSKAVYLDASSNVSPLGTVASGTWNGTAIVTTYGGTGLTSYTAGDLPYYASGTTLSKLGIGANTTILTSSGTAPQWSTASSVSVGTATNLAGGLAGSVPYQTGAGATTFLGIGSAGQILTSTGTAPQWSTLSGVAVTTISFGTTGLTPATATSGAVTVAGTLATTNGGTGLTSFTANQVFYASSTSAIGSSANLTFNGTTLTANDITDSSLTSGRVTFAGTGGNLTDSANLTWNGSTLGITGALTASADSSFTSTGALLISKGTTLQQPGSPATGMMRYNTTTNQFEGYSGASPAWKSIGGSALSNDTSTASNLYPVFAASTTGTAENLYTSNAKLLYKPSTGELQASELLASNGVVLNNQTMNTSYTMPSGYSGMSVGPFTVASGVTFTIPSGSRHVVL